MKTKSLLFLAFILIVATFALASCDAMGGVVDKIGDLPLIGDLPFFEEEVTTTAADTTTAPVDTTAAPDVTTAPAEVTTTAPAVTTTPTTTAAPVTTAPVTTAPVDPFKDVAMADGELTYDGEAKALAVTGAPDGAVITYVYTKGGAAVDAAIDAGEYAVTATISYNGESTTKTATLTIKPATADMSGVLFSDKTSVYDPDSVMVYNAANLPEGIVASYVYKLGDVTVQNMKDAGEYTVIATFKSIDSNYVVAAADAEKSITYTITKKAVAVGATFEDSSAVYTGKAQTYEAATGFNADLFTVTYTYSGEMINAGEYTVTATFALKDAANYELDGEATATATFTVLKKKVAVNATFANGSAAYTGKAQTYEAAEFDAALFTATYAYSGEMLNVGEYTVTATFALKDAANYELDGEATATATFTITPKDVTIAGAIFAGDAFTYDGSTKTYNPVTGYDATIFNVTYAIEGDQVNAGSFTATATFALVDAVNYNLVGETTLTATYTIAKQKVAIGTLAAGSAVYTGKAQTYEAATGFNADLLTVTYTYSGEMINAGEYTVTATFALKDAANYEIDGAAAVSAAFVITKQKVAVNATMAGGEFTYDGTEKGYNEATGFDANLFNVAYTVNGDAVNAGEYTVTATFTLKDAANYEIEGAAALTATYVIAKANIDLSGITFADSLDNVYTGAAHDYEIDLPEGLKATYAYSGNMTDAGTYTVTATISKGANYNDATLTATYVILPKTVSVDVDALAWNVDGATKFGKYYAFQKTEGDATFAMVLVGADALEGVTVTYTTTKLAELSAEKDAEVDNTVTELGTYETVATFTAANGNYVLTGATSIETTWGVYDEFWSPIVK